MPSPFASLLSDAASVLGRSATYTRGLHSCQPDDVMRVPPRIELVGELELGSVAELWDYLISAAELVLNSTATEPAEGDTITEGGKTYQVLPLADGRAWRWSDPDGLTYRVHTKRIA